MKLLFKHLMCAALLIAMPLTFTSCNVKDNPLESSEVQGLIAALQEGAVVSYTIMENGVEKTITFKKEGGKFVLKSVSPATTRMHDVQENKRYILDWGSDDGGSGNGGGTNNGGSGGGGTLVLNVYAADGTPALTVVTRVADAFTQIATYNENYDLKGMTLNGQQQEQFNQALEKSKSGPKAKIICNDSRFPLNITISIPNLGVTTWKDINYDGIKLKSDANNNLILTYKCKVDPDVEPVNVRFSVYNNTGESTKINDLVGVPSKEYKSEYTPENMEITPLTLEAIEDGTIHVTFSDGLDLAKPITYTKNGVEYPGGTTNFDIPVSAGDIVTFHSTNAALGKLVESSYRHPTIKPTNRCYIYGNIMSLIDDNGDFATDETIGGDYAFYALFSGADKLESHPINDLLLPATTLTDYCYNELFSGCSALTKAPALPATVLKLRCYEQMFWECTSLKETQGMSATTVADYCCHDMFYKCKNLVKAPELLATTLTQYCYNGMFKGCSKLNYLKCLATDVSATECLGGWLGEVSATGTLVVASGTTWPEAGTNYPATGWTVTTE